MVAVPNTRVRMSHALTLRAGSRTIGAIHQWAPSMSRTIDVEFELQPFSRGMPVDLVPQNVDGREIRVSRYDTYPEIMEEVFGTSELIVLSDQYRPFTVFETWRGPGITANVGALTGLSATAGSLGLGGVANALNQANSDARGFIDEKSQAISGALTALGTLTADLRAYVYQGCYFTNLGRSLDAKSDRVVSVEATLMWLSKQRVA